MLELLSWKELVHVSHSNLRIPNTFDECYKGGPHELHSITALSVCFKRVKETRSVGRRVEGPKNTVQARDCKGTVRKRWLTGGSFTFSLVSRIRRFRLATSFVLIVYSFAFAFG